jgi:hypothetical protein
MGNRNTVPCFYCALDQERGDNPMAGAEPVPMQLFTVHDQRGCLHVCFAHAAWRRTTSTMGGHDERCGAMPNGPGCRCGHRADQHGTEHGPCCRCDCIGFKAT